MRCRYIAIEASSGDRVLDDEIERLVVEVADTRRVVRCSACGFKSCRVHETRRVST